MSKSIKRRKIENLEINIESVGEINELIKLKSWELSNRIDAVALKNAFPDKRDLLQYLTFQKRLVNNKVNEFDRISSEFLSNPTKEMRKWYTDTFSKIRRSVDYSHNTLSTMIRNLDEELKFEEVKSDTEGDK